MNRLCFPFATLTISAVLIGCSSSPQVEPVPRTWHLYHSTAGKYTVSVPRTPREIITTSTSKIGPLQDHNFTVKLDKVRPPSAYMMSYIDFPAGHVAKVGAQTFLEETFAGGALPSGAQLLYRKNIDVDGWPGIEFQYKNGKAYITSRNVVQNDRFFQMSGINYRWEFENRYGVRYVESFHLDE